MIRAPERDPVGEMLAMVTVAQSVESQIVILVVAGSSPVGHPTFKAIAYEVRAASSMVEQLTLNQ